MKWDLSRSFEKQDQFLKEIMAGERDLFSFRLSGETIFSRTCPVTVTIEQKNNAKEQITLCYDLAGTGVFARFDLSVFKDFPYMEYEVYFTNPGTEKTEIIDTFRMLEFCVKSEHSYYEKLKGWAAKQYRIVYYLGSVCDANDFHRREKVLLPRHQEGCLTLGGNQVCRSSECHLPFFRIDLDDFNGYDFGIGWTGSWQAELELNDGSLWLHAGMPENRFYLKPGETLRGPGAFIGFRADLAEADQINVHRHFMMTHHAPRNSRGEQIVPPITAVDWGGIKTDDMLRLLDAIHEHDIPIEVHWIDTAWMGFDGECNHPCDPEHQAEHYEWWQRVGNYRINRYPHPDGLRPVTDRARQYGLKTLAWFEPERYCLKCQADTHETHPDWFLKTRASDSLLVDLGNDEARKWITGNLIRTMHEEGIENYREEMNVCPYQSWYGEQEPADRRGVREMKHIAGLYQMWRDLRNEFPDMFIDNCASGGRRLDYVLATDSFPLCQSDYACFPQCEADAEQLQNSYLNEVYPLHSPMAWMHNCDLYASFSSGCGVGINSKFWNFPCRYPKPGEDMSLYRKILLAIKEMRTCILGNFYLLTPDAQKRTSFCATQTYNEAENCGYVLVFRRAETKSGIFHANLFEIEPDATYEIREFSKEELQTVSGKDLADFTAEMPEPRSVRLFFYRKMD